MRTKSFPVRSWQKSSGKSLDSYPSPSPLPDEANETSGSGVRDKLTAHCNPYCDSDDANVEAVPDTFDERRVPHKKRHCCETDVGGFEPVNLDACIVCGVLDNWVSHCSGIDCLVSFHAECLNAELGCGEDVANSYCPYCWFKILALKYKSLREKAAGAEDAVLKHLDKEMKSRGEMKESVSKPQEDPTVADDENGNQEHSVDKTDIVSDQELQGDKDAYSSKEEHVQVEKDSGKSRDEDMPSVEEAVQSEEDKGNLEVGTDKSREDKMLDSVEAEENEERVDTENKERLDTEDFQDAEGDKDHRTESFLGKEHKQVQQNEKQRSRRRRIVLSATDSEISSNESTNEQDGEDVTEQKTSSTQVISPARKMKKQSNTVRNFSFFKKDQRRRLLWTYEEEEMLKVGVEKFAAEANKNMPWRKILEMGEKVFHETRTPADLKDKWRNMIGGRLGQKTNKTTH